MLVSTVTAMTSGRSSWRPAASSAACRAACIIFSPPLAWTLTIQTPSAVAARTAPATVFGMSWYLRSRKTRSPRAASSRTSVGPFRREQLLADLESADMAAHGVRRRQRLRGRVHVERDQNRVHACEWAGEVSMRPDQVGDPRDAVPGHVVGDAVEDLPPDERIHEVGGADLDGVGAGDEELQRVARIHDAAHPDDRDLHLAPALVDHPHGDRADGRAAEPAHDVGQLRPPGLDVDGHREKRVDQRDRIGAGVFGRARKCRRAGDVRRELGNHRQVRDLLHGADDTRRCRRGCTRTGCRLP